MAKIELTDRQTRILKALRDGPAHAAEVAQASGIGGDPRGVAQTLRRLRDTLGLVVSVDAGWKLSRRGAARARAL